MQSSADSLAAEVKGDSLEAVIQRMKIHQAWGTNVSTRDTNLANQYANQPTQSSGSSGGGATSGSGSFSSAASGPQGPPKRLSDEARARTPYEIEAAERAPEPPTIDRGAYPAAAKALDREPHAEEIETVSSSRRTPGERLP